MSIIIIFSLASGIYTLYEAINYAGDDIILFSDWYGYWLRYVLAIFPYIALLLGIGGLLICLYTKYDIAVSIPLFLISIILSIFSLTTI